MAAEAAGDFGLMEVQQHRRRILRRIQSPRPIEAGIEVWRPDGSVVPRSEHYSDVVFHGPNGLTIRNWHVGDQNYPDDRDYTCPTCQLRVRLRGVVSGGELDCCGAPLLDYELSPPRPEPT